MKQKVCFFTFFLFLCLPGLSFPAVKGHIDSANHEKRTFAAFPPFSFDLEEIKEFPSNFENWFNDHLPYKNQLVAMDNQRKHFLREGTTAIEYKGSTCALEGKHHWLFYNAQNENESSFDDYLCNNLYSEDQLKSIADRYVAFDHFMKEQGADFVLMYAANKEQVYPEYMPSTIIRTKNYSRTDQLVDYLRANTGVPVLYTKNALIEEKENGYQVFAKYDTHWNNLGGFVGGQLLNEYYHGGRTKLADVRIKEVSNKKSGDLADLLAMGNVYNDDKEWVVEGYKENVHVQTVEESNAYYEFSSDAEDKRRVLLLTDSFGYALMAEIPKDFSEVTFLQDTNQFRSYIETRHPDIVVVEIVERARARQEQEVEGLMW